MGVCYIFNGHRFTKSASRILLSASCGSSINYYVACSLPIHKICGLYSIFSVIFVLLTTENCDDLEIRVPNGPRSIFTRTWLRYVRVFAIAIPPVVCLSSITLVHPTQEVEPFGNISSPLCTLVTLWPPYKLLRRLSPGNPSSEALKTGAVVK